MYEFKIKINKDDLYKSSLNNVKNSKTFIFDLIFTAVAIIATAYQIFTNQFFQLVTYKKVLLIVCCILFPIVQPLILYIKSILHANKIKDLEVKIAFDDNKITVSALNDKSDVAYENVYNFIKYNNMIVLMYDSIHGQIIPNRVFNDNKESFYNYVSERILNARKKQKQD